MRAERGSREGEGHTQKTESRRQRTGRELGWKASPFILATDLASGGSGKSLRAGQWNCLYTNRAHIPRIHMV